MDIQGNNEDIIGHAEDYASELERGQPPSGFENGSEDYTILEVLKA